MTELNLRTIAARGLETVVQRHRLLNVCVHGGQFLRQCCSGRNDCPSVEISQYPAVGSSPVLIDNLGAQFAATSVIAGAVLSHLARVFELEVVAHFAAKSALN